MKDETETEFVRRTKAAAIEAAKTVVHTAQRHNTPIIVWKHGKTIEIDPVTERAITNSLNEDISKNAS